MPLLEQVLEQYPKDVKLVFKNFPLASHRAARPAAVAAMAADEQGKFWEFHDRLFQDYAGIDEAKIQKIAEGLGLDMQRFEAAKRSPQILGTINRDLREAQEIGVRGTPTIYVNGRLLRNRSPEGFRDLIEKGLAERGKPSP